MINLIQDLISPNEIVQDAALKSYYKNLHEKKKDHQRNLLDNYLFVAHYVNPALVLWFVLCYWCSGMLHYYMVSFGVVIIVLVIITSIIVLSFVTYFWCWKIMTKSVK